LVAQTVQPRQAIAAHVCTRRRLRTVLCSGRMAHVSDGH
jgi:hypothetical protein